jgi:hypothetical protein
MLRAPQLRLEQVFVHGLLGGEWRAAGAGGADESLAARHGQGGLARHWAEANGQAGKPIAGFRQNVLHDRAMAVVCCHMQASKPMVVLRVQQSFVSCLNKELENVQMATYGGRV